VLKLFSRGDFEKAVQEHKAERHARGFTSWGQFTAMLFCQLGRAHSLREICGGLACCEGQLQHLGVPVAPKKSTLAYANEHRPWGLYQTVFEQGLCCKNNSVGKTEPTANLVGRLFSFQSEDFPDELNLPEDIPFRQPPHLAFPDHLQNLVALNRPPGSIERSKTLAGIHPPLDPSMVLFHHIV
jgi:hypothetical protein